MPEDPGVPSSDAPTSDIEVIVSDFGGVLTTPLWDSFVAVNERLGLPAEALGGAMAAVAEARGGENPLHALERGELSERDFLDAIDAELSSALGRPAGFGEFSRIFWANLHVNSSVLDELRRLRDEDGYRLALLTNNVREWEPTWRRMIPVDELFEVVVDSGFVGARKPEPEIYRVTLERLGASAEACVLLDDFQVNCDAARAEGWHAVQFTDAETSLPELRDLLARQRQLSLPSRSQR